METKSFETARVFNFASEVNYADNAVVSKTIIKNESGTVTLFAFDKGEGLSEHTAPFDAMVTILDGEAEIIIGGKSFFLIADNTIIMPAGISHALKATEAFKMLLVMVKAR